MPRNAAALCHPYKRESGRWRREVGRAGNGEGRERFKVVGEYNEDMHFADVLKLVKVFFLTNIC